MSFLFAHLSLAVLALTGGSGTTPRRSDLHGHYTFRRRSLYQSNRILHPNRKERICVQKYACEAVRSTFSILLLYRLSYLCILGGFHCCLCFFITHMNAGTSQEPPYS